MKKLKENVLDNPAWEALNSVHAQFALGNANAKRYKSEVLPFTGCEDGSMVTLDPFIEAGESFFIIGDELPVMPSGCTIELELPCAQMLLRKPFAEIQSPGNSVVIEQMNASNAEEMHDLITAVQPGYYNKNTHMLGSYFGIRDGGRLVAMAGERMRINGFSELSAICTLPGYTGRGFAQQLIAKLCNLHASQNVVSFLHVALANQRAIQLYQHLGFEERRTIMFRRIRKSNS